MKKDLVYERLFGSNRSELLFDSEESEVASFVYNYAYNEIHAGQEFSESDTDSAENFNERLESTIIRLEKVTEIFKNSRNARRDFLKSYGSWAPSCRETIISLRKIAEELKADKFNRDLTRAVGGLVGAIGGLVTVLTFPVSGPLATGGALAFAAGNAMVVGTTSKEIAFVKENLEKVKELIEEEKRRFSSMAHWFYRPEAVENAVNSLVDYDISREMSQEMKKLIREVTGEKDLTEEEFKDQFQQVLKHCMSLMAKDSKLINEYGKELAPAVMTYIFVVLMLKDHNRIVLDCSLITQHLALGLANMFNFGGLAGQILSGSDISRTALSETFVWFAVIIDVLIVVLSVIDLYRQPETKHSEQIKEAADKIEKVYLFIDQVYNKTREYKAREDLIQWRSVIVINAPDDTVRADLKMAVANYLPAEALDRMKIIKIPTEVSNFILEVPEIHSQKLLRLTEIKIKNKSCVVTH